MLVAGIGNIFFGDDGFGVEVAHRLTATAPSDTRVADFGIRAIHFAFELLEQRDLCIVVDCMGRGGAPGTLYVVEPAIDELRAGGVADAHGMNLPIVFTAVRELGGELPKMLVVGCEPEALEPRIGLSTAVTRAIPGAIELINDLLTTHRSKQ
jgi:hydrogenase maturation protease